MTSLEILEQARDKALSDVHDLHQQQLSYTNLLDEIADLLREKRALVLDLAAAIRTLQTVPVEP